MEWRAARLYLLFTPRLCAANPWQTLQQTLAAVDLVQWRVKQEDPEGLRRCIDACGEHDVPVIVNDHVQLALEHGAAGAHVGQGDMPAAEARAQLGPERCLGVSTHSREELRAAIDAGADHVGFGPCFRTSTKDYTEGQPPGALAQIVTASPIPVFAIGGIGPVNLDQILAQGCSRIAVSSAILRAPDPGLVARELRDRLG